ncbi:MAG: hypothetical protein AAF206_30960, partial [Bacteroidota bacterium]
FGAKLMELNISGYNYVRTALDYFQVIDYPGGRDMINLVQDLWGNAQQMENKGLILGGVVALLGPIFFLLYSLGHFFRGLAGKQYKRGIFFMLLFSGYSYLVMFLLNQKTTTEVLGQEIGIKLSFLEVAGPGFWVAVGAIFLAAISVFFEKKKAA